MDSMGDSARLLNTRRTTEARNPQALPAGHDVLRALPEAAELLPGPRLPDDRSLFSREVPFEDELAVREEAELEARCRDRKSVV